MNLQKMKYLHELVRSDFNVSAAARALHTSQPAISKQIRELERQLGQELFIRQANRLVRLTPIGQRVAKLASTVCATIDEIQFIARETHLEAEHHIRIATIPAHARFILPEPMQQFSKLHPRTRFQVDRALPADITNLVRSGEVDLGVTPVMATDEIVVTGRKMSGNLDTNVAAAAEGLAISKKKIKNRPRTAY